MAPLRAAAPEPTRFVLVTATLAENVYLQLQQDFPGITPAFGPGDSLHMQPCSHDILNSAALSHTSIFTVLLKPAWTTHCALASAELLMSSESETEALKIVDLSTEACDVSHRGRRGAIG